MTAQSPAPPIHRRVTPIERLFTLCPFSIVTLVARLHGTVTEEQLRHALDLVRQRHANLRVRMVWDEQGDPWFTSDGAGPIPIEVLPRQSAESWQRVMEQSSTVPFDFSARPAVRLFLLPSAEATDLILLCHHILCDGLSLAYVVRDLLTALGQPDRDPGPPVEAAPMGQEKIPREVSVNPLVRLVINRMNKQWRRERVTFDQVDYQELSQAYWSRYPHRTLSLELDEAATTTLVERCRRHEVTVNSALSAALVGAQVAVLGDRPFLASTGVAASLRERLTPPVGEGMGFYAGMVTPKFKYDSRRGFWDNARAFHRLVTPLFNNKALFENPLLWCLLEPSILDAMNYKRLGGLVAPVSPRYDKLSAFARRGDTVLSILKRDKMDTLERITMGTAVTNLGRLDFPRRYGELELERLILQPGGGFPLVTVNLVLGAVTCAGRLSCVLEYVDDNLTSAQASAVQRQALGYLSSE